jgi:hypothetical protein
MPWADDTEAQVSPVLAFMVLVQARGDSWAKVIEKRPKARRILEETMMPAC